MDLISSYSLQTGLKIDKPYINLNYFPIPFEKYITIHNSSGMASKNYSYWQEVVDILLPVFAEEGIRIVQIGGKDDKCLNGCYDLCGKTKIHETSYVLKGALLHMGNDSFSAHMSSSFDVDVVIPFGPTSAANHGPRFGKGRKILLEPQRNPTFAKEETPKTVDMTPIEDIVNSVLSCLGKDKTSFQTVFTGELFGTKILEYVPDFPINQNLMKEGVLNVRMDYHFDEQFLLDALTKYKCHIITEKPIDLNIISKFRGRIHMMSFEINQDTSLDYVEKLVEIGAPFQLITEEADKQKLSELRFKFFDYEVKQDLPSNEKINIDKTGEFWYKCYKMILSNNQAFMSKSDWLNNKPTKSMKHNTKQIFESDEEFLKESKFFLIFKA